MSPAGILARELIHELPCQLQASRVVVRLPTLALHVTARKQSKP